MSVKSVFESLDVLARIVSERENALKHDPNYLDFVNAVAQYNETKKVLLSLANGLKSVKPYIGVNCKLTHANTTNLDKDSLESFLALHGKTLDDFVVKSGYWKVIK